MSSSAARRRPSAPATTTRSARFPVAPAHPEPGTVRRGLSVMLEVPTDGPGTAELLSLAGTLHELALEAWQRTLAVNLTGVFLCLQHELRVMREQGAGSIVNVAVAWGCVG